VALPQVGTDPFAKLEGRWRRPGGAWQRTGEAVQVRRLAQLACPTDVPN
jgi:hypothetical protein